MERKWNGNKKSEIVRVKFVGWNRYGCRYRMNASSDETAVDAVTGWTRHLDEIVVNALPDKIVIG